MPSRKPRLILENARIVGPGRSSRPSNIFIDNGKIVDEQSFGRRARDVRIDLSQPGLRVLPGSIDVHMHGMHGIDPMTAGAEDFRALSRHAASHGTTGILPTTISCSPAHLRQVLENFRAAQPDAPGARLLGLHIEGTFISKKMKGAQVEEFIYTPGSHEGREIRDLIEKYQPQVRIVTVAPEVPGVIALIRWLVEHKIVASIGHTDGDYRAAQQAIEAGATHATHTFNRMRPLHHREPTLIGAVLADNRVFAEFICDGVHLCPDTVKIGYGAKDGDTFVAITDSLHGAGFSEGETFEFGDRTTTIRDGASYLPDGTLAGSITTMDKVLHFLVEKVGIEEGWAGHAVSAQPAMSISMQPNFIQRGQIADLTVYDADFNVRMTIVGGKIVYRTVGDP